MYGGADGAGHVSNGCFTSEDGGCMLASLSMPETGFFERRTFATKTPTRMETTTTATAATAAAPAPSRCVALVPPFAAPNPTPPPTATTSALFVVSPAMDVVGPAMDVVLALNEFLSSIVVGTAV